MFKFISTSFRSLIAYLIFDLNWHWLEFIIDSLCELEMQIPLIKNVEFKELINRASIRFISPIEEDKTPAEKLIPENTFYCEDCCFYKTSKLANFFYGGMSSGYCYYLGKGDFSYVRPTDLLWDGCKECGINEEVEDDLENQLET